VKTSGSAGGGWAGRGWCWRELGCVRLKLGLVAAYICELVLGLGLDIHCCSLFAFRGYA